MLYLPTALSSLHIMERLASKLTNTSRSFLPLLFVTVNVLGLVLVLAPDVPGTKARQDRNMCKRAKRGSTSPPCMFTIVALGLRNSDCSKWSPTGCQGRQTQKTGLPSRHEA